MKAKRRLLKIHVDFISLVGKGANKKVILWKSGQKLEAPSSGKHLFSLNKRFEIAKVDEDQRLVTGIVYAPDEIDTEGDFASAEVIKEAAYSFMQATQTDQVDKGHDEQADEGFVAESWIVKEGDPTFKEVGAWAVVIKVTDDKTWKQIKRGDITGLSMGGQALAEELEKEGIMKFSKTDLVEALKKAWYEIRVSGDLPGGGADDVPSVQDQLAGVFKDSKVFKAIDNRKDAEAALAVVKETVAALEAGATEFLKDHLGEPEGKPKPEPAADPGANDTPDEGADLAKILKTSLEGAIAPLLEKVDEIATRVKVIEDSPLGPHSLDPEGGREEVAKTSDGKRIIQFFKRPSG